MKITEAEFARICRGIYDDRESIIKHNPLGSRSEILLWMLLSSLVSYLSLTDTETPCFNGKPDEQTYRDAIAYVLSERRAGDFNLSRYFDKLAEK